MVQASPRKKPFVIGLIGGIAAGKSHVAKAFQNLGVPCIDADHLAHEVLGRPLVVRRLGQVFGEGILAPDGSIDRKKLGLLVFGKEPNANRSRAQLEEIVHPLIHAAAVQQLRALCESDHPPAAIVLDAPLLIEAGWEPMCDAILFVDTPFAERLARVQARGWTENELVHRESVQIELQKKRAHATHVVSGNADDQQLRESLISLLEELTALT